MSLPKPLHDELIDGLTLLDSLNLSFGPRTVDDLIKAAGAWEWVFCAGRTWETEKDTGRIVAAFTAVAPKLDKWPSPKLILEHLPPRPLPPPLPKPDVVPCPPEIAQQLQQLFECKIINQKNEEKQ